MILIALTILTTLTINGMLHDFRKGSDILSHRRTSTNEHIFPETEYEQKEGDENDDNHVAAPSPFLAASLNLVRHELPRPLDRYWPGEERVFVHVGKSGGSSFDFMLQDASERCQELLYYGPQMSLEEYHQEKMSSSSSSASFSTNNTKTNQQWQHLSESSSDQQIILEQLCALADIQHAHTNFAPPLLHNNKAFSQYVVVVRNPIDRLVSWYSFEQKLVRKKKNPRNKNWKFRYLGGPASQNAKRMFESCYTNVNEMVQDSLVDHVPQSQTESTIPALPSIYNANASHLGCAELARRCLHGEFMCFCHNYYNYEFYLEDLLLWSGQAQNSPKSQQRDIRVDVVRLEHVHHDLNRTLYLWTGQPLHPAVGSSYRHRNAGPRPQVEATSASSSSSASLNSKLAAPLCRHICYELITYKKVLWIADNLAASEVAESYRELDESCGFNVDEVCGTAFYFRNTKSIKWHPTLPW